MVNEDNINLRNHLEDIIQKLKHAHKNYLAKCIEDNWDKTALAYSAELNFWNPQRPMEPELLSAFETELERLGVNEELKEKIITSLNKRRILQTAPHLVATENPRMLTINWLGSLAVPSDEFYVVGMFSGIPFSNSFRPGRINRDKDSVNLFPSSMQDDLVYESKIPEKLLEVVRTLPEPLKSLLPEAVAGASYTKWALQTCQNIERKILGKENLIYIDINEVVANYWEEIKNIKDHPMNRIKELKETNLFMGFAPLLFNNFKCFGSFRQVEYLPEYQNKMEKILAGYDIEKTPTANLTTGVLPQCPYPADIIMGAEFKADPNILFGELLMGIKDKLK